MQPTQEEVESMKDLLQAHRSTLHVYLHQQAKQGDLNTSPVVVNGIAGARKEIRRIKIILREWGEPIGDHPNDEVTSLSEEPITEDTQVKNFKTIDASPVVSRPEVLKPSSRLPALTITVFAIGLFVLFVILPRLQEYAKTPIASIPAKVSAFVSPQENQRKGDFSNTLTVHNELSQGTSYRIDYSLPPGKDPSTEGFVGLSIDFDSTQDLSLYKFVEFTVLLDDGVHCDSYMSDNGSKYSGFSLYKDNRDPDVVVGGTGAERTFKVPLGKYYFASTNTKAIKSFYFTIGIQPKEQRSFFQVSNIRFSK